MRKSLTPIKGSTRSPLEPHPYKKTDVIVYTTTDYDMFAFAKGNRSVNQIHLTRLIESMKTNYLFTIILVNFNMEIIDGQHRLEACKLLELPVHFTIVHGYGLKEMQILNLNSRNWQSTDYLSGFIDMGKQDYIDYKRFKSKYKFGHDETILLLSGAENKGKRNSATYFNMGQFKVLNYQEACRIADKIWELEPIFPHFKARGFVTSLTNLIRNHNKFSITDFITKCESNPSALKKCATRDQYMDMIEYIYNYRRQEKVSLKY